MRWDQDHESDYVEDRRGEGPVGGGGGLGLIFMLFQYFGPKGALVGALLLGGAALFSGGGGLGVSDGNSHNLESGKPDAGKAFVSFVLDDVQSTWQRLFAQSNEHYRPARLVLFAGSTRSACGLGQSATGPFYCPRDQKVYIDLSFYRALKNKLGAPGDFAQAYVIAHEIGHHITNLKHNLEGNSERGADGGSVRVELQADCYAGVWAHSAEQRKLLQLGDIDEAMRAAQAIGDDTLQKQAGGSVRPESFSHGTSAQRMRWFKRGYESGKPEACNTFDAKSL